MMMILMMMSIIIRPGSLSTQPETKHEEKVSRPHEYVHETIYLVFPRSVIQTFFVGISSEIGRRCETQCHSILILCSRVIRTLFLPFEQKENRQSCKGK